MGKTVDVLSILLLVAAAIAFTLGVSALGDHRDLSALYWLAIGALSLHASVQLLRPRSSS